MKFKAFTTHFSLPVPFKRLLHGVYVSDTQTKQLLVDAAKQLASIATSPAILSDSRKKTPTHYLFDAYQSPIDMMSIDFALTADGPRLVELQSFPSIFPTMLSMEMHEAPNSTLDGRTVAERINVVAKKIQDGSSNGISIILDLQINKRMTTCDFHFAKMLFGVRITDLSEISRRGDQLFIRMNDGCLQRIGLIWNRLVPTELSDVNLVRYKKLLSGSDVNWIGHMDHFFSVSKASMPYLTSQHCVPCGFVSDQENIEISDKVLKPLYDFAGRGVNLSPSHADIRDAGTSMIWQNKITFTPCIEHNDTLLKGEARVTFIRSGNEWVPLSLILRSSADGFSAQTTASEAAPGGVAPVI